MKSIKTINKDMEPELKVKSGEKSDPPKEDFFTKIQQSLQSMATFNLDETIIVGQENKADTRIKLANESVEL